MKLGAITMGAAAMAGLLAPTMATAAETRSPAVAPVSGVRSATPLRHSSKQSEDSSSTGMYVAAGLAAAVVVGGVIVAVSHDRHPSPASPG
jgi:hypothetical protein